MNKTDNALHLANTGHYTMEMFWERMTTKEWKLILLDGNDKICCHGVPRQLVAKKLGCGIVEVRKAPLE
ncbi:MAG: hypothetical protein AABY32_01510 [Nanoarchaeota archaeon]